MNKLKEIGNFIIKRPFLSIAITGMIAFGFVFIFLGSLNLFFKLISRRPLFYFGIYVLAVIITLGVYSIYSKTKHRKITSATFNQLVRDASRVLRAALLLFISLSMATYMATRVITVYFSNYHATIGGGVGNVYNLYPSGLYNISEPLKKIEKSYEEQADAEKITTGEIEEKKEEASAPEKKPKTEEIPAHKEIIVTQKGVVAKEQVVITVPNVFLSQEYPSSQGYIYTQSINLSNGAPAVMTIKDEEQPMWFGIVNRGLQNVNNPVLFLEFNGDFKINVRLNESLGWNTMEPNKQFNIKLNSNLQPGSGFRLHPLFVRFERVGVYEGKYSITSDDNLPRSGIFTINVTNQ